MGLFADALALAGGCEDPSPTLAPRTLFRSDSAEGSRGEKLMHDAIREGTDAPGCSGMLRDGDAPHWDEAGGWAGVPTAARGSSCAPPQWRA